MSLVGCFDLFRVFHGVYLVDREGIIVISVVIASHVTHDRLSDQPDSPS